MIKLTKSSSVPLKMPAPPDAKLTPVTVELELLSFFDFDTSDRYGGAKGSPTFSAAKIQILEFRNKTAWRE